jgi:hypothetical protein
MAITEQFSNGNKGGIISIELIDVDEILDDSIDNLIVNSSTKIYFVQEEARYTVAQKKTDAGSFFESKIIFSIPKIRQEVIDFIANNSEKYFVALVKDVNEINHKIGKKIKPLRFESDMTVGSFTARNEARFELFGKSLKPSREYNYTPTVLTTTTIMYESLSINLTANVSLNYQMPLDMDLSTLIAQFYLASGEQTEVAITAINNTTKVITLFAQESVTVKMNAITKAN